jgi:hypothetical protein
MKQQFVNTSLALFSGAVAGAVSRYCHSGAFALAHVNLVRLLRTATSPLERLKVMRQVQHSGQLYTQGVVGGARAAALVATITCKPVHGCPFFAALVAMYKNEGVLSMWKGNGTCCVDPLPPRARTRHERN